ncbi:MAG: molybdopterin converting factor subunit 1 [Pseudomonadota bacterium]
MLDIRYFAWLRERLGTERETVQTTAETVLDLVAELRGRGDAYAVVFADLAAIRVAVDQELGGLDTPISDAHEVAFFPPMTGG